MDKPQATGLQQSWFHYNDEVPCAYRLKLQTTHIKNMDVYTVQTAPWLRVNVCRLIEMVWVLALLTEHLYVSDDEALKSLASSWWITRCPDGRTWTRSLAPPAKGFPAVILTLFLCQNTIGGGLAAGGVQGMATRSPRRALVVFAPDTVQSPKAVEEAGNHKSNTQHNV